MRRPRVAGVLLLVVAALVAGACNKSSPSSFADRTSPSAGDVFLEPLDEVAPNAFTDSVAMAAVPPVTESGATGGSSTQGLRSVAGTTDGLYGGSASQQPCDAAAAIKLLAAHHDNAQAWADALNNDANLSWSGGSKLSVDDVASYVSELTSVVLLTDTRVTDNELVDGRAKTFQAVLQRGTAVMIDALGVPRARCASFSPLTAPTPASSPKYRGTHWAGFDPTKLVTVTPGDHAATSFTVVDLHTHQRVQIPVGQNCGECTAAPTTTTTEFSDTTTTSKSARTTTTTIKRATTTTAHPATTTTTTHAVTSTTEASATTTTAP